MVRALFLSAALVGAAALVHAQEQADPRTLIPSNSLNAIAQHVSGAPARNHVTRSFRDLDKTGAYSTTSR